MGFVVVVSIGFVGPHEAGLSIFTEYHIGDGIEDLSVPLLGFMQSFLGTLACDDFSSQRAIDRNGFTPATTRHWHEIHQPSQECGGDEARDEVMRIASSRGVDKAANVSGVGHTRTHQTPSYRLMVVSWPRCGSYGLAAW